MTVFPRQHKENDNSHHHPHHPQHIVQNSSSSSYTTYPEVKYPLFLECSLLAKDIFWKFIFEDMAQGRFPFSTFMQKDYFCCHVKGKEFVYRVFESFEPMKPASQIYLDIQQLLYEKLGVLSEKEQFFRQQQCFLQSQSTQSFSFPSHISNLSSSSSTGEDSWNFVRKRLLKEHVLESFLIRMKHEYDLSYKVLRPFLSMLIVGFLFKSIPLKDIHYGSQQEILSIEGIQFSKKKIIVHRPFFSKMIHGYDEDSIKDTVSSTSPPLISHLSRWKLSTESLHPSNISFCQLWNRHHTSSLSTLKLPPFHPIPL